MNNSNNNSSGDDPDEDAELNNRVMEEEDFGLEGLNLNISLNSIIKLELIKGGSNAFKI